MFRTGLIAAVLMLGVTTAVQATTPSTTYREQIQQWRAQRLARLTAADGWLSLIGLDWLQRGANRIGSAADNDIVVAGLPPHLGTVTWLDDGTVSLELGDARAATVGGVHRAGAVLLDDSHPQPTVVQSGSLSFYLISRGDRKGLRIKDAQAPTRVDFTGLEYFPIDPALRIVARWVPFDPPHHLDMANQVGGVDHFPVPGKAVFQRDGHTWTLYPVIEEPGDSQYFLVFADATSGRQTYGAGRFLYVDPPHDGTLVIDFNKAYNPPCSFTPYATCPLAPPENRLGFAVDAGEKLYRHGD